MKARLRRKRTKEYIRRHTLFAYCDERLVRKISHMWSNGERDRKRAKKNKQKG